MGFAADVSRLSKGILNERLQVLISCVARWLVVHCINENSFLRRSGNDDGIPAFAGGERVPDSSGLRHVSGAA